MGNFDIASLETKLAKLYKPFYAPIAREILLAAKSQKLTLKILDIGSAYGYLQFLLSNAKISAETVLVEPSKACADSLGDLAAHLEKIKSTLKITEVVQSKFQALEAPLGNFDIVSCASTLHEIVKSRSRGMTKEEAVTQFLKKSKQNMKKNGVLVVADHYFEKGMPAEYTRAFAKRQKKETGHADHYSVFVHPEILALAAKNNGLKIRHMHFLQVVPGKKSYVAILGR